MPEEEWNGKWQHDDTDHFFLSYTACVAVNSDVLLIGCREVMRCHVALFKSHSISDLSDLVI